MNDEYPDMEEEDYPAIKSAALPQYAGSPAFRDRLLIAGHEPGSQIQRCEPVGGPKYVESTELEMDSLEYFIDNKISMADEFLKELVQLYPEGQDEYQTFCQVISEDWSDGKTRRTTGRCRQLKRSVLEYLGETCNASWEQLISGPENPTDVDPLISGESLKAILTVNKWMLHKHIEQWKQRHPDNRFISDDDVYFRRGLRLDQPFKPTDPYVEFDFINSYSIGFTAPEKFSQKYGQIAAIVSGDLALFEGRVLFFSPFIRNMDARQLELGVIPSCQPLPLHCQGDHGGILEYLLDPPPFQR